jgi:hypothetical protein
MFETKNQSEREWCGGGASQEVNIKDLKSKTNNKDQTLKITLT